MTDLKKKIPDYDLLENIADNSYLLINQSGIEYKVYASNFKTTIVDNLTTESATSVLSASQGMELKRLLDYNTATRLLFNYESFWTITNDGNDVEVTIPAGEIRLPNDAAYSVATATGTIPEDGGLKLIFNPLSNSFSYSFLSASTLTGITEGETDNEYIIIKNIGGVLYTFNASLGLFINVISHNDLDGVNVAATDETAGHVDNTKPLQLPERTTTEEGTDTHNNGQIWFNKTLGTFRQWKDGALGALNFMTDAAQTFLGVKSFTNNVGFNNTVPFQPIHVKTYKGDNNAVIGNLSHDYYGIIVESEDAVLGLISNDEGGHGSGIDLMEVDSGVLKDKWWIGRLSSSTGKSYLQITHGSNSDYALNNRIFDLTPDYELILPNITNSKLIIRAGATVGEDFALEANGSMYIYPANKIQSSVDNPNTILPYDNSNGRMVFNTTYHTSILGGYEFNINSVTKFLIDGLGKLFISTAPSTATATHPVLYRNPSTGAIEQYTQLKQTTITSSATTTPTGDARENELFITALAIGATIAAPTGTAVNGNTLMIRIEDNGTARALAWNAIYEAVGVTLPTTTILGKKMYIGFIYNSNDAKWDCVSVVNEV